MKIEITPEFLKIVLDYDPITGLFRWKARTPDTFQETAKQPREWNCAQWNGKFAGERAFITLSDQGYLRAQLCGRLLRASRVAWAIYYGRWPVGDVDHIDRIRTHDWIENLRDRSRSGNLQNKGIDGRNTSGANGVSWASERAKWNAYITTKGKRKNLGYFDDLGAAIEARRAAEVQFWGYEKPLCDRVAPLTDRQLRDRIVGESE